MVPFWDVMSNPIQSPSTQPTAGRYQEEELRAARFAMRLSLAVGVVMLLGKTTAYYMTGSAAILSDFAESVVHVHCSGIRHLQFATEHQACGSDVSLRIRAHHVFLGWIRRRDDRGRRDLDPGRSDRKMAGWIAAGTSGFRHAAAARLPAGLNAWLGWYLLRVGKRTHSLILEATASTCSPTASPASAWLRDSAW